MEPTDAMIGKLVRGLQVLGEEHTREAAAASFEPVALPLLGITDDERGRVAASERALFDAALARNLQPADVATIPRPVEPQITTMHRAFGRVYPVAVPSDVDRGELFSRSGLRHYARSAFDDIPPAEIVPSASRLVLITPPRRNMTQGEMLLCLDQLRLREITVEEALAFAIEHQRVLTARPQLLIRALGPDRRTFLILPGTMPRTFSVYHRLRDDETTRTDTTLVLFLAGLAEGRHG